MFHRIIGSWACEATWVWFKNGGVEITIPTLKKIHIENVSVCPRTNDIIVLGRFEETQTFLTNKTETLIRHSANHHTQQLK